MKAGDLQRPNSLLCFFACHVILMVHTDLQDGDQSVVVLRIARLFSRFIENQKTVSLSWLLTDLFRMKGMSSFMADTNLLCIFGHVNVPAKMVLLPYKFCISWHSTFK